MKPKTKKRTGRVGLLTSGGARWAYLAGYGWALKQNNNDDAKAREYITAFYKHVPVLGSGARDATTTFARNNRGGRSVVWIKDQ